MRRSATRPLDRDVQVALIRAAKLLSHGAQWRIIDAAEAEAVLRVIDAILTTRAPEVMQALEQLGELSPFTRKFEAVAVCKQCIYKPIPQYAACRGCKERPSYIIGEWVRGKAEEADK